MALLFLTIMRMFVTGVSGAPVSAVVRKVASSAGVPFPSNATAASVSGIRFSIKLSTGGGVSCALTQVVLTSSKYLFDQSIKRGFSIGNWQSEISHSRIIAYIN